MLNRITVIITQGYQIPPWERLSFRQPRDVPAYDVKVIRRKSVDGHISVDFDPSGVVGARFPDGFEWVRTMTFPHFRAPSALERGVMTPLLVLRNQKAAACRRTLKAAGEE